MILAANKISGRVDSGAILPRLVRYYISLGPDQKVEAVERLSKSLAHRLQAQSVRVAMDNAGRVVVEVPRLDPVRVTLAAQMHKLMRVQRYTAILGLSVEDGVPLLLRLPSPTVAHILIAGMTGSGKTELAKTIAVSLARYNRPSDVQMVIGDPQGRYFKDLAWLPHLLLGEITTSLEDMLGVVGLLANMVEERAGSSVITPRVVLFIDELADMIEAGGDVFQSHMDRLMQRGRGVGIHVVACTQKPLSAAIGSLVKGNFPVRLVGSVANPEDAKTASGLAGSGAEKLLGRGDFLLVERGKTMRFQAAIVTRPVIDELRAQYSRPAYRQVEARRPASGLDTFKARVRSMLRVVQGGRGQDEEDARRVVEDTGFTAKYWDPARGALRYGHQSAIGTIIGVENRGNSRARILRVAGTVGEILSSSYASALEKNPRNPPAPGIESGKTG